MSEAPKKRWYVVQAFSGFERVATSLREHIKLHNMEDLFGRSRMVPTEEVDLKSWRPASQSRRKFFPRLRPRSDGDERRELALVRSVPRVMGFIGWQYFRSSCANQR